MPQVWKLAGAKLKDLVLAQLVLTVAAEVSQSKHGRLTSWHCLYQQPLLKSMTAEVIESWLEDSLGNACIDNHCWNWWELARWLSACVACICSNCKSFDARLHGVQVFGVLLRSICDWSNCCETLFWGNKYFQYIKTLITGFLSFVGFFFGGGCVMFLFTWIALHAWQQDCWSTFGVPLCVPDVDNAHLQSFPRAALVCIPVYSQTGSNWISLVCLSPCPCSLSPFVCQYAALVYILFHVQTDSIWLYVWLTASFSTHRLVAAVFSSPLCIFTLF